MLPNKNLPIGSSQFAGSLRSVAFQMALDAQLKKELGERVKTLRLRDGRTLRSLADLVPVSDTAWKNWEKGKSEPRWEHYEALARIFEQDIDFIRFGERRTTPDPFGHSQQDRIEEKIDRILKILAPEKPAEDDDSPAFLPERQPAESTPEPDQEAPGARRRQAST